MSYDLLSFSPSLLDILSLIEPKAIPKCQLVSIHFNRMIARNRHLMKRPRATLECILSKSQDGRFSGFNIVVEVNEEESEESDNCLWISETRTDMIACHHRSTITEYYKDNGIVMEERKVLGNFTQTSFETSSFDHGLRLALRYFFKRYYFDVLRFDNDFDYDASVAACDWYQILCKEFKECRTACEDLSLCIWTDTMLRSFYVFGSIFTFIDVRRDLGEVLEAIPRWDSNMHIKVTPEAFTTFGTIFDFLKNWESGKNHAVKSLFLRQHLSHIPFLWDFSEVIRMIRCLQVVKEDFNELYFKINIRRRMDNRTLNLRCWKDTATLILKELEE